MSDDLISRQAAIEELEERIKANGYSNVALVSELNRCIGYIMRLPSVQPEVTEEAVKDYCHKRCLTVLTNEYFHSLTSAQPERCEDCENFSKTRLLIPQPDIIVCADCKHWICHDRRCGYWNHGVKPLDWCCHAERRSDE